MKTESLSDLPLLMKGILIIKNLSSLLDKQRGLGSGKTMVLLHRLSALKYKQRYFDFPQNALILTSNEQFSLHIKGLAEGLQIGSVHRISVEQ